MQRVGLFHLPNLDWEKAVEVFLWSKEVEGLSGQSLRGYKGHLRTFIKFLREKNINCQSPQDCSPQHIQLYFKELKEQGRSPHYLLTLYNFLSVFFNWLEKQGLISNNPIKSVPKPKVGKPVPRTVTEEHFLLTISTLNKNNFSHTRLLALLLLAFDSGARLGELLNLRVGDVDLTQRTALVRGKGNKQRYIFFGQQTAKALRKWLTIRFLVIGQPQPNDYLFCYRNGSPLDGSYVGKVWRTAQLKAGLKPLPFHGLRHGFARCWLMNGGDGFSLQRLLGHTTPAMTSHYVTLWGSDLQKLHNLYSPVDRMRLGKLVR